MSDVLTKRMSERESRRIEIAKRFELGEFAKQPERQTSKPDPFEVLKQRSALAIAANDLELVQSCLAELDKLEAAQ